ncbi:MAG: DUF2780 domain-containing protein [Gammaproteobacteria bacterium]|nr:DUF2780 domain-containing protein [Gammaproteobacteria bacterium]
MKSKQLGIFVIVALTMMVNACSSIPGLGGGSDSDSANTGLVNMLTSQLGVSNDQAMGGAGALLGLAKSTLSSGDFAMVGKAIPGMDSLLGAAPKDSKLSDKLSTVLGDNAKKTTGLGDVAGSFSKLGLSPDMVGKFAPVIMSYAQSNGGDDVMSLLKGVWQ